MNRCTANFLARTALTLSLALAGSAWAQHFAPDGQRTFPADIERGEFTVLQSNLVQLGDAKEQLAPGARIFNLHNRIQLPVTLAGQKLTVNYRRNATGQIAEVWLLSAQEAQTAPRKNPGLRKAYPSFAERQRALQAAQGIVPTAAPTPVVTAVPQTLESSVESDSASD